MTQRIGIQRDAALLDRDPTNIAIAQPRSEAP